MLRNLLLRRRSANPVAASGGPLSESPHLPIVAKRNSRLMPSRGASAPTVLITGAARRIGRALALDLARAGWQICVHYRRSADEALKLVAELESLGASAAAVAGDLA